MTASSKKILFAAGALVLAGAAGYAWFSGSRAETVKYRTAPVKHGSVVAAIGATGTIEPEEVVDIGAQVAGQILVIGKDAQGAQIDYGSQVDEGMLLVTIDESLYKAEVDSTNAQLEQARASRATADAALLQAKARLVLAGRDWNRAQVTGPAGAISASAFDAARSAHDVAVAEVSVAEASVKRADADIVQAEATLSRAKRNLNFCVIKSPVKGVVIDRRVNIGQTVVSSLNAPSLFLIAKDLRRMEVWVSVNEVDIGRIHEGMDVTFTVDTFQGRKFHGKVAKRRLNASMTQNVVTYVVEVAFDNTDGVLLPYLTANVKFETGRDNDTLYVPNAALAWAPDDFVEPVAKDTAGEKPEAEAPPVEKPVRRVGKSGEGRTTRARQEKRPGAVWVLHKDAVSPERIELTASLSDGIVTAVSSDKLHDGDVVVTGEARSADSAGESSASANPFAPPVRKRGR